MIKKTSTSSLFGRLIDVVCLVGLGGLVVMFFIQFLARYIWWLELFTHFYLQYFVLAIIIATLIALRRRTYRLSVAVVLLMLYSVQLLPYYYQNRARAQIKPTNQVEILFSNFHYNNTNYEALSKLADTNHPDLIALVEMPRNHFEALKPMLFSYQYSYQIQDRDHQGIAIFSKEPLSQQPQVFWPVGDKFPVLTFYLDKGNQHLAPKFYLIHPPPPLTQSAANIRNQTYNWLAQDINQQTEPVVIMGDFNSTAWSPQFTGLMDKTGLNDSRANNGVQPSWPSWAAKPLRIPIDHILVSDSVEVVNREILSDVGSDHLPVLINLAF